MAGRLTAWGTLAVAVFAATVAVWSDFCISGPVTSARLPTNAGLRSRKRGRRLPAGRHDFHRDLDDSLMDRIREELDAGTDRAPSPLVPFAPRSLMQANSRRASPGLLRC